MSTTGFVTAEFTAWSSFAQSLILILVVIGACAGSTAGGFKISRLIIAVKSGIRELRHVRRPNSVNPVRLEGEVVKEETVRAVGSYVTIYVIIVAVSTLLLSFDGFSFETNFSVVLTTVNNVGPALGEIGSFGSVASYSYFSKIVMCFNMLAGRLELLPMLILFSPRTWKRG
jgi:trk system potassium uptake protein TrkH